MSPKSHRIKTCNEKLLFTLFLLIVHVVSYLQFCHASIILLSPPTKTATGVSFYPRCLANDELRLKTLQLCTLLLRGGSDYYSGGKGYDDGGNHDDDYDPNRRPRYDAGDDRHSSGADYGPYYGDEEQQQQQQRGRYGDDASMEDYYGSPSSSSRRTRRSDYYTNNDGRGSTSSSGMRTGLENIPGVSSLLTTGNRKLGILFASGGALFTLLGISLFFNKTLLRMGNLLFMLGVPLILGPGRTAGYFLQPTKARATACLVFGIFLVLVGRPILGMALEIFGILNLFGNMFPVVMVLLRQMPFIGDLIPGGNGNRNGNKGRQPSRERREDYEDYNYYDGGRRGRGDRDDTEQYY